MSAHDHTYTALWWHYGPYGPQDVHLHSCFNVRCDHVLVGDGRGCDGKYGTHRHEQLGARRASRGVSGETAG